MLRSLKRKTEAAFRRRKNNKSVDQRPPLNISWPLRNESETSRTPTEPEPDLRSTEESDQTSTINNDIDSTVESSVSNDPEPEADPFITKYVPFVETSAMKSNMFVNPASSYYGMVNPAIMSGFGGDDESIWLVDDEETDGEAESSRRRSTTAEHDESSPPPATDQPPPVVSPAEATSTTSQEPQPGFRYRINLALFDDDEFGSPQDTDLSTTAMEGVTPTPAPPSEPAEEELPPPPPHEDEAAVLPGPSTPHTSNPYVALLEQQEFAMTEAYLRRLDLSERRGDEIADDFSFGQRYQKAAGTSDVLVTNQRVPADLLTGDRECMICVESKEVDLFPRFSVTASCTHPPTACLECLEMSIRSDLNSKLWTDIRCPECRELLDYTDIQRYADTETFRRYETLALRAAMAEAENFFWCTSGCGSGQIHDSGRDQPIVICLHCDHRSCFHHNVAWHQGLTCDEYDQLLADPENFRSRLELDNEAWEAAQQAQLDADRAMAQGLLEEERRERERREQREREERERTKRAVELARQIAARRKEEEEKSRETVGKTTKPCPGCGWAIEKNDGCSHMTCIKCRHEFCWGCNQTWTNRHSIHCRG